MKLQHLAIIFVIIILPISMVVSSYIQTQIDTITLQTSYSTKLQTATYDAIKAFQLNTINNKYSSVSDSKIRDIEASISAFYDSLASSMGASGYDQDSLKQFIPAMLYTMYDGYYIYGKYYNYSTNEYQYGLKPYIYYSCRYQKQGDDFVVNYTLDNAITIYGKIGGQYITKAGYLIDPELVTNIAADKSSLVYDGETIQREILSEQLVILNNDGQPTTTAPQTFEYTTYQNRRVYYDKTAPAGEQYFWYSGNKKQFIYDETINQYVRSMTIGGHLYSESAIQYYYQAYEFSKWVKENLGDITQKHAVDAEGARITDFAVDTGDSKIFQVGKNNNPLLEGSTFQENRMSVIRNSIQSNLAAAIANYNEGTANTYEFVLPIFSEENWDKIVNHVSVATFMQGVPIGTKFFNNYCIMTNNKNKEVVTTDSLYVLSEDGQAHLPGCKEITNSPIVGCYKNVDFERQTITISDDNEVYYYPHANAKDYNCLVNVSETYSIDDIISGSVKIFDAGREEKDFEKKNIKGTSLRRAYLTALGRERYDLYKTNFYFGT